MPGADWSPALEIVDLRVPGDHHEVSPPRRRLAPSVLAGRIMLAAALLAAGVLVGSRLQMTDGAGIAVALPVTPSTGNVVEFTGGIGRIVTVGPAVIAASPGRLVIDDVQRGGVLPTNSLTASVGDDEIVVIDSTGRVHVATRAAATPIYLLSPGSEFTVAAPPVLVAD